MINVKESTLKAVGMLLAWAIGAGLGACGGSGDPADMNAPPAGRSAVRAGDILVYESRQSVQCGSRGLTTQQSALKLTHGGIDVVQSACGAMTGVGFPAVCGAGTGEILMHEIRSVSLSDAEQLGFQSVATLQNPALGTDYAWVDCQTGLVMP